MRSFSKIYKEDLDNVGKKAVELAELFRLGIPIPDGFVITTSFFKKFLKQTGIDEKIKEVQKLNHPSIQDSVKKLFNPIKKQILYTPIPGNLITELHKFYRQLAGLFKEQSLNVFSSSLNNKSVSFLNIKGDANLLLKIKEIWTMHINQPVAIIVQENIASKTKGTIITSQPPKEMEEIARKIQKHFYFPQELDYVIEKGKIYVTGLRHFTGKVEKSQKTALQNNKTQNVLVKGISINPGIVTGPVKILSNNNRIQIKSGEIIVISQLNKSFYGKIKKAKAIVADSTLLSSYDQMLYRKSIKIPIITDAVNATRILQNGNIITVNGINGEVYSGGLI